MRLIPWDNIIFQELKIVKYFVQFWFYSYNLICIFSLMTWLITNNIGSLFNSVIMCIGFIVTVIKINQQFLYYAYILLEIEESI
jgi:hypothetical protein